MVIRKVGFKKRTIPDLCYAFVVECIHGDRPNLVFVDIPENKGPSVLSCWPEIAHSVLKDFPQYRFDEVRWFHVNAESPAPMGEIGEYCLVAGIRDWLSPKDDPLLREIAKALESVLN